MCSSVQILNKLNYCGLLTVRNLKLQTIETDYINLFKICKIFKYKCKEGLERRVVST